MPSHLLCCQGLEVDDYSFALGRLEAGAPSTFAQGKRAKAAIVCRVPDVQGINPC